MIHPRLRFIVSGATVAVLGLAVVAGSALAAPAPATSTPATTNYRQVFLQHLAGDLGIDQAKLTGALKQAGNQTVDQEVTDGKLTSTQATKIKSRIAHGQIGGFWRGGFDGPHGRRGLGFIGHNSASFNAIATTLGMDAPTLRSQLKSGQSIAAIAKSKGVTEQQLGHAIATAMQPRLDAAVKANHLTAQREKAILQNLQQGKLPFFNRTGRNERGRFDHAPKPTA